MPITEEQRIKRREAIGSSDMAAVLGISPYKTPYDVWLEKTGRLTPEEITNDACDIGNRLEDPILTWFAENQQVELIRQQPKSVDGLPIVGIVDAIIAGKNIPVEAKTAGMLSPLSPAWGEPGTDQIPENYIIQCHVHIMAWQSEICYVPAFLGGKGFCLYLVNRDPALVEIITEEATKFWSLVESDTPPEQGIGSPQILKRVKREPAKTVEVDSGLIHTYIEKQQAEREAKKAKEDAQAALLTAMGDAEAALATDLGQMVTYFEYERKGGIDGKRLASEMPDVFKSYQQPGTRYRSIKLKKFDGMNAS